MTDATIAELTTDRLIALSDVELALTYVDVVNELARNGGDLDARDRLIDTLDGLGHELIERLSAEAGRAAIVHFYKDDGPNELLDAIEGLRQRQAARLLRDTLKGGENDG
jgi:hypothetical protein